MTLKTILVNGPNVYASLDSTRYRFKDVADETIILPQLADNMFNDWNAFSTSKKEIADTVQHASKGMTKQDMLLLYIHAHGIMFDGGNTCSVALIGPREILYDSELKDILDSAPGKQFLVTNACLDYGFGKLANERRAVITHTRSLRATVHGFESLYTELFDQIIQGKSCTAALDAAVVEKSKQFPIPHLSARIANHGEKLGRELAAEAVPTIHGPPSAIHMKPASFSTQRPVYLKLLDGLHYKAKLLAA